MRNREAQNDRKLPSQISEHSLLKETSTTCNMMETFYPGKARDGTMMSNADWTGLYLTVHGLNSTPLEGVSIFASKARIIDL